jgi:hypothetical protein
MIVVSKLDKPRHLKQMVHKDFGGDFTEILNSVNKVFESETLLS